LGKTERLIAFQFSGFGVFVMQRAKALFVFLMIIAFAYVAWVVGPPYFANYQFQDDLNTEVRFMQNGGKSDDEIKASLIKKALDDGFTLTPQQIKITHFNKTITVQVDYAVHVDMPGYSTDLKFHPSATNTLVM
jgi:hypothetical protein